MTAPSRATVAGRTYLDLQNKARGDRRPVDELLQLYVLESFLARLAESPLADRLVLKGGVLLAAFGGVDRLATSSCRPRLSTTTPITSETRSVKSQPGS